MIILRAATLAALFLMTMIGGVLAQDVTLTSRDGTVEISGDLLGFDGEFYRVETLYGELTVDGSGVLCDGPACPNLTDYVADLTFSGADTMGRLLMPALVQAFANRGGYRVVRTRPQEDQLILTLHEAAQDRVAAIFRFNLTSADQGFADLLAGDADIVMAQREASDTELAAAEAAGLGDLSDARRARVLALDALVPIVATDNPMLQITVPDLARILTGEIANWSELDGPDAPITLHLRSQGAGLWQVAQNRILAPVKGEVAEAALRYGSDEALAEAVSRDPFGLGLSSATTQASVKPLALSGACGFALRADRINLKTEDYPLSAPMFLYLPARRLPKIGRDFMRFTRSDTAQLVIRRAGLTDQSPEEIAINQQGDRFANSIAQAGTEIGLVSLKQMVAELVGRRRVSLSFRFEAGSTRLDAQSRSNVALLAQQLEAGLYDARSLLFAGFSDGDGGAEANQQIAQKRAEAVLAAVLQAAETLEEDQLRLRALGFGEVLPMACDDSAWGRQVNRRVEVWAR